MTSKLLIGGLSEIDIEDWQKNTDYRGYTPTDDVVKWFWEAVRSWPMEKKSRLLQFTTGTSRTPVNGFRDLQGSDGPRRFTIEKAGKADALPKTHTVRTLSSGHTLPLSDSAFFLLHSASIVWICLHMHPVNSKVSPSPFDQELAH